MGWFSTIVNIADFAVKVAKQFTLEGAPGQGKIVISGVAFWEDTDGSLIALNTTEHEKVISLTSYDGPNEVKNTTKLVPNLDKVDFNDIQFSDFYAGKLSVYDSGVGESGLLGTFGSKSVVILMSSLAVTAVGSVAAYTLRNGFRFSAQADQIKIDALKTISVNNFQMSFSANGTGVTGTYDVKNTPSKQSTDSNDDYVTIQTIKLPNILNVGSSISNIQFVFDVPTSNHKLALGIE